MKRTRRPTITDVADLAGVGVSTVSRVINRMPGVSEEMSTHIEKAIKSVGFKPLAGERRPGPRTKKTLSETHSLGFIELVVMFPLKLGSMEDQAPIYSSVFDGIEKNAMAHHMSLSVLQYNNQYLHTCRSDPQTIARIFFGCVSSAVINVPYLNQMPSVWTMGMNPPLDYRGDMVHVDHFSTGSMAAQALLESGHTCVAFIGTVHPSPERPLGERSVGFRHTILHNGGTAHIFIDQSLTAVSATSNIVRKGQVYLCLDRILALYPRPTAIFLEADMLAPVFYEALYARAIIPQKDLVVMSCNNERSYLDPLRPSVPVVDVFAEDIGFQVVDSLVWRLKNPKRAAVLTLVKPKVFWP